MAVLTSNYPTSLDTTGTLGEVSNRAKTTLSVALADTGETQISLSDASAFPTTGAVTIDNEIFYYSNKSANVLTIESRAQQGTVAATHSSSATVYLRFTKGHWEVFKTSVINLETKLGTGSSTPTTSTWLKGTGTGTSAWSAITKTDVGLSAVENTALSTWAGTSSITTVGTIGTGTWQGTIIGSTYGGTGVNNAGRTLTINTNSGTIAFGAASKTLTVNNSVALTGTDGTTMTFPSTSATIARTDAANTFTGVQTFSTPIAATSVATMTSTVGGGVPTPPNNTTTFLRGDGTFAAPAAGGTVTNTGGNLTLNAVVLGAGTVDTKVSTGITTNGTAQLVLGVNVTTLGTVKMFGNTSGDVTIQPTAAAGTATVQTLPATTGTLVNRVTTANGVSASNSDGALTITLGAITPTTVNGNTFTTGTYTLTGTAGKTLTFSNTLTLAGTDSTTMTFPAASTTVAGLGTTQTFTGINTLTPTARASGVASYLTVTMPSDTGQTATTESIGVNFTAGTRTWADGTTTLQREHVFGAPTYARTTTSATFTTAVNVDIANPVAGAGVTITNNYGLRVVDMQATGKINNITFTQPATASTFTLVAGKTLTVNNTLTFSGTDSTTMTFPTTSATLARTDAANTFTGVQTFSTPIAAGSVATMTATVGGGVPTPPNNTTTFLRGDGTFAAPSGGGTVTATGGSLTANSVVLGAGTTDTKVVTGITTNGVAQLVLGVNVTTLGTVKMFGNTSGDVTIQPTAVAGTATVQTLPATTGTLVNRVTTANGVSASNSDGALTVTLGNITPTQVTVTKTTEQLRVRYDVSNYYTTTVGTTGGVTFDAVGSGAQFNFSDKIIVSYNGTGLEVQASTADTQLRLGNGAGSSAYTYDIGRNASSTGFLTFYGNQTTYVGYVFSGVDGEHFRSIAGAFGIGTGATVSARLHVTSTTEQLRVGYSSGQYWKSVTDSAANTVFTAVGTAATFQFANPIQFNAGTGSSWLPWSDGNIYLSTANIIFRNASNTEIGRLDSSGLNLRPKARVTSTTSSSTPTPNCDNEDLYILTALAAGATFGAVGGTATSGQRLLIRIKDNGTARTLAWNAVYRAMGVALPTTTVISKTLYVGFIYNSTDTKWDCVSVAQEA